MKRVLICLVALLLWTTFGSAQEEKGKGKAKGHEAHGSADAGAVKTAIQKMEEEMRQATLKGDPSALEKYAADDYHNISGATGQASDKKQSIERLKSGAAKYSQINVSDNDVQMYDDDMAISHGIVDLKLTLDGKDVSGKYHFARTWLKRHGKWQAVWLQSSKVQ
jgi:hypothetical protein